MVSEQRNKQIFVLESGSDVDSSRHYLLRHYFDEYDNWKLTSSSIAGYMPGSRLANATNAINASLKVIILLTKDLAEAISHQNNDVLHLLHYIAQHKACVYIVEFDGEVAKTRLSGTAWVSLRGKPYFTTNPSTPYTALVDALKEFVDQPNDRCGDTLPLGTKIAKTAIDHYLQAIQARSENNLDGALDHYQYLLDQYDAIAGELTAVIGDMSEGFLYEQLGDVYTLLQQQNRNTAEDALNAYQQAVVKSSTETAKLMIKQALVYTRNNQLLQAERLLDTVKDNKSHRLEALHALVDIYKLEQNVESAVSAYTYLIQINPAEEERSLALYLSTLSLAHEKKLQHGLEILNKLLNKTDQTESPSTIELRKARALINEKLENFDEAITDLEAIINSQFLNEDKDLNAFEERLGEARVRKAKVNFIFNKVSLGSLTTLQSIKEYVGELCEELEKIIAEDRRAEFEFNENQNNPDSKLNNFKKDKVDPLYNQLRTLEAHILNDRGVLIAKYKGDKKLALEKFEQAVEILKEEGKNGSPTN